MSEGNHSNEEIITSPSSPQSSSSPSVLRKEIQPWRPIPPYVTIITTTISIITTIIIITIITTIIIITIITKIIIITICIKKGNPTLAPNPPYK